MFENDWCNIKTEDRYPCWNGASVVSIIFDSFHILHIFISELLDYLLPIKNVYTMGGVEVVKLQ